MARTFTQALKAETSPAAVPLPSTYQYGPPGARRARTFSQVIADATRGVDAGMNRFTAPRPDLSSDAYAPDWRGHYLGKRDFAAVLKDVRAAIETKPAPMVCKGADGAFEFKVPISKTDDDQNLVFGWAQVIEENGVPVTDSQGDQVTEKDLEDAFYYFAQEGRETDEMHTDEVKGQMVECMVFSKEKQQALGINLGKVGAWVGFKVDDDTFAKVKSGDLPMFSIGGVGRRIPLEN